VTNDVNHHSTVVNPSQEKRDYLDTAKQ